MYLSELLAGSDLIDDLYSAGFHTVRDVLLVTDEELAARVNNVGPVRAKRIRQRAIDAVIDALDKPNFTVVETSAPETPLWRELLLGFVGIAVFLFLMTAAMVMLP
jgi:hypothetical protein